MTTIKNFSKKTKSQKNSRKKQKASKGAKNPKLQQKKISDRKIRKATKKIHCAKNLNTHKKVS